MISLDSHLAVHATAVRLRSARAQILAANIANADTPGYRAQDIRFRDALESQLGSGLVKQAATHPAHFGHPASSQPVRARFRDAPEGSLDENTVNSEFERIRFAENEVRYRASIGFLSSKISGLLRVIRGE